jgi:hypothetical protein
VSVKMGFLYMANSKLLGVLWMVTSRKFSLWSHSSCAVKIRLRCILLKSSRILYIYICLRGCMIRMSGNFVFVCWERNVN